MWIHTNHSSTKLMAVSLTGSKAWKCHIVHIIANMYIKYCHSPPYPDHKMASQLMNFGHFFTCKPRRLRAKSSALTFSLGICFFPVSRKVSETVKMPCDRQLAKKSVLFLTAVLQTRKNVVERWMDLILRDVPQHRVMWLQCAGLAEWVCCLVNVQQCMLSWSVHLFIKSRQLPLI